MTVLLTVVAVLLLLKLIVELTLDSLNARHVEANRDSIPSAYRDSFDSETYSKMTAYTLTNLRFGKIETGYGTVILAILLFSGVLPWLYYSLTGLIGSGIWSQSLVVFTLLIITSLPAIPFEWWQQFRIEEQFGFNKTTPGLWLSDKLKGLMIGLVLGVPILALLLWFFQIFPLSWWLWGWAALFVFQLLMMILWPRLILPLFNKLEPLPEGELRDRLMSLSERTGFQASTIEIIDGSKRSGHSNAFFTGFGRFRRIVLFDTLVDQLSHEQLEAVLAHEIGHYKLGHIPKMLTISAVLSLASFAILGFLSSQDWFYQSFGFSATDGMAPALILFLLLSGIFTFWLAPLTNIWSRKHEYEADDFAAKAMNSHKPLVASLRKLHKENLSNLTPHPLYSFFHYSHPTLQEREDAMGLAGPQTASAGEPD